METIQEYEISQNFFHICAFLIIYFFSNNHFFSNSTRSLNTCLDFFTKLELLKNINCKIVILLTYVGFNFFLCDP